MIKIVTDSDSNLTQSTLDEYGIEYASIHIIFGDEVYREYREISVEDSFARMAEAKVLPTTSQPPVGEFKEIYEDILAQDPDATILSIHISGPMSGTIESARQAAELLPDADIHTFDTRSASLGQGLMAVEAARMANEGAALDAILTQLELMRERTQIYFVLNTLENLARSGRIGRASHLMANMLDIKPVLTVTDGIIDAHTRHRTWKRALANLRDSVLQEMADNKPADATRLHLGVMHAMAEGDALDLLAELKQHIEPDVFIMGEIGPGLGVHTGPGAVAVCWVYV